MSYYKDNTILTINAFSLKVLIIKKPANNLIRYFDLLLEHNSEEIKVYVFSSFLS